MVSIIRWKYTAFTGLTYLYVTFSLVLLLFPFLAFMIEDMGYTGEQLGYHAGILAATFCGGQFCTSVAWGMVSDKYGRKFAIVLGTLGAGVGMLIFGFSQTFAQGEPLLFPTLFLPALAECCATHSHGGPFRGRTIMRQHGHREVLSHGDNR